MKFLTIISSLTLVMMLASCNQKTGVNQTNATADPDSLAEMWSKSWIAHDSAAIANMLTDKTQIIFSSGTGFTGRDSIIAKWVVPYLNATGNIESKKLASGVADGMVYYAVGYSREIIKNDSVTGSDKGTFMAVWKLQDDNSWKLETMHFGCPE